MKPNLPCAERRRHDSGFTLIELAVAMSVFGILAAISVWGLRGYERAQQESTTAHDAVSVLRNAQERALSEGRTYCVQFDPAGTTWTVWRYSCNPAYTGGTAAQVQSGSASGTSVLTGIAFTIPSGMEGGCPAGVGDCAYFYPRGTASPGSVTVTRGGSSTQYLVKVEGLTGRVHLG